MGASDVCETEDAIQTLLEYFVDPMLPAKSSVRDNPSESHQQSVAIQVHAVVLLYNYYHRKQQPELKYCDFDWFCKLAVAHKPAFLAYLKLMQRSDDTELDDLGKQLSITEKKIMDACNISTSLYASKGVPSKEGWPVSKVTVFLIDSIKENCLLQFSLITQGVWSVIEKDLNVSIHSSEKHVNKRKRIPKNPLRDDEFSADEEDFKQVAFSAVEEATKISQTDLMILEGHVVYSLSKEKSAACFYIMQCTLSKYDDIFQVPIKDAIDSSQGPLVHRSSSRWTVTPVVEYFHLLPYAGILSDWQSRLHNMDVNDSYVIHPQNEDRNSDTVQVNSHKKTIYPSTKNGLDGSTVGADVKIKMVNSAMRSSVTECSGEKVDVGNRICNNNASGQGGMLKVDGTFAGYQSNSNDLDKPQTTKASKENILPQAALKVLLRRRDKLSLELRNIEDEIAQCDRNIQRILNGAEDDFALKIESIIEGCSDVCLKNGIQERIYQHTEEQGLPQYIKRKKLSEVVLNMQSPCQELDSICYDNNWILPTYRVSSSDGGFQANACLKGIDFECSSEGGLHSSPREARESAAAQMLVKLRSMVKSGSVLQVH